MNILDKQNKKMKILVNKLYMDNNNQQVLVKSKDIICIECKEPCRYTIDNGHIKLYDCPNNHIIEGIKIDDFPKTQLIDISKIICGQCNINNKGNSHNYEFYKCLNCNYNLCILCKSKHNINHNIIKYDDINYICPKHNDTYSKYCEKCKINICFSCENEHNNHKTIYLSDIRPDLEKTRNELIKNKKEFEILNKQIKSIITNFNDLIRMINIYIDINTEIINNYNNRNRNYNLFQNINEITNNNKIYDIIKNINEEDNIKNKINKIIDLHNIIKDNKISMKNENKKIENKKNKNKKIENKNIESKKIENKKELN